MLATDCRIVDINLITIIVYPTRSYIPERRPTNYRLLSAHMFCLNKVPSLAVVPYVNELKCSLILQNFSANHNLHKSDIL